VAFLFIIILAAIGVGIALFRPAHFLYFAIITGPLSFGGQEVGALQTSSIWLLIYIALSMLALLRSGDFTKNMPIYEKCFVFFVIWCGILLLFSDNIWFATRVFVKFAFPLLAFWLGRSLFRYKEMHVRPFRIWLKMSAVYVIFSGGVTWTIANMVYTTAGYVLNTFWAIVSDFGGVIAGPVLVAWRVFRNNWYLLLLVVWFASSTIYGVRTGILALLVGVSFFIIYYLGKKSFPFIFLFYLFAIGMFVFFPNLREKTFRDPDNINVQQVFFNPTSVDTKTIDSSGRFYHWEFALDRFFYPQPIWGSGIGATQIYGYTETYMGLRVIHSSYVRLLCDVGLIGFILYVSTMLLCMIVAYKIYRSKTSYLARIYALIVLTSFPALMVCMGFDNMLDYIVPVTQYPFLFTGIMMSAWREESKILRLNR